MRLGRGRLGFFLGGGAFAVGGAGASGRFVFVAVGAVVGLDGGEHAPALVAQSRLVGVEVVLEAVEVRAAAAGLVSVARG